MLCSTAAARAFTPSVARMDYTRRRPSEFAQTSQLAASCRALHSRQEHDGRDAAGSVFPRWPHRGGLWQAAPEGHHARAAPAQQHDRARGTRTSASRPCGALQRLWLGPCAGQEGGRQAVGEPAHQERERADAPARRAAEARIDADQAPQGLSCEARRRRVPPRPAQRQRAPLLGRRRAGGGGALPHGAAARGGLPEQQQGAHRGGPPAHGRGAQGAPARQYDD